MATSRGKSDVRRFMAAIPGQLEAKVLRGAAMAGANVIADEARSLATFGETREAITVKLKTTGTGITATVTVKKGYGRSVGFWLEYGTSPHLISVDDSQRKGRSVARINRKANEDGSSHSLVIGGAFVGDTVMHPGARAHPFLRPALDLKGSDAVTAAQSYINSRVRPSGIVGDAEPQDDA